MERRYPARQGDFVLALVAVALISLCDAIAVADALWNIAAALLVRPAAGAVFLEVAACEEILTTHR
jgi:hypothetical protein